MSRKLGAVAFGLLAFNVLFFSFQQNAKFGMVFFGFGTVGYFLSICAAQIFLCLLFRPHLNAPLTERTKFIFYASLLAILTAALGLFRANALTVSFLVSLA